jgi:hypothetical protein
MSRLPDWLHPWRWYAAPVIIEAVYRAEMLGEREREIGVRFGRSGVHSQWRSLRRWRAQLLMSPSLWGWLALRLGIGGSERARGTRRLKRFLSEIYRGWERAAKFLAGLPAAVRATLQGLVHNRAEAWSMGQFRPGTASGSVSGATRRILPTEKDSGRDPPGQA